MPEESEDRTPEFLPPPPRIFWVLADDSRSRTLRGEALDDLDAYLRRLIAHIDLKLAWMDAASTARKVEEKPTPGRRAQLREALLTYGNAVGVFRRHPAWQVLAPSHNASDDESED